MHPSHHVCIHGHFYQPPRENPWTGHIERQPSASPFHDWNERVTHECYAPNTHARILDAHGKILDIVNNYKDISFNIGATLLSWLESHRPDVYAAILDADVLGQRQFNGHGPAIAQVYSHLIMPLANARDQRTQVIWGLRDFAHRFKRPAHGMWLAETAVDLDTLEALAEQGVTFTILAPHQAQRIRPLGADASSWKRIENQNNIDTSRAYLQVLPSGKSIILFFYDGPTSRAVAFEKLLDDGARFARRLISPLRRDDPTPQLSHIATDGESYGHHHTYGEMALAYALREIREDEQVNLTIYGEWLERFPPELEVQIAQNTSWSCAHGIERWRSHCGCQTGGPHNSRQAWRKPLREALDALRDQVNLWFEAHAQSLFHDPWGARDRYIEVLLHPEDLSYFTRESAAGSLPDEDVRRTMNQCMILQHQLMLMYTSCAWFFHDLAGIETIQILRYAGRAIELFEELSGVKISQQVFSHLERAVTHDGRNGLKLFDAEVLPLMHSGLSSSLHTRDEAIAAQLDDLFARWSLQPEDAQIPTALLALLGHLEMPSVSLSPEPYQNQMMALLPTLRGAHAAARIDRPDVIDRINKIMKKLNFSMDLLF